MNEKCDRLDLVAMDSFYKLIVSMKKILFLSTGFKMIDFDVAK